MPSYETNIDLGIYTEEGFKMLADQKQELLRLIDEGKASDQMNGLVHLIDHIQDQCIDNCRVPQGVVLPYLIQTEG
jgi:hypothetical protein